MILKYIRLLVLISIVPLPSAIKVAIYRLIFGWKIGRNVRIGFSLIEARNVEIGDFVKIGSFNLFRNCQDLVIGDSSIINNNNKIYGSHLKCQGWINKFQVGVKCYITSGHFFDIGGGVIIDCYTVVGGRDTHIWSHSIKIIDGRRELVPIRAKIGEKSYIGARVTLVCNSIPARTVVGAGSIIAKTFPSCTFEEGQLIAGNPAKILKKYRYID